MANKQTELSDHQEKLRELRAQLCCVSQESDSLKAQLVQLNSHYQEATEEASNKTKQLDTLELERRKLQQELYASQQTVSTLKETLTAEETEKKKVQGMLEATRKEVERWEENDREIIINWAKSAWGCKTLITAKDTSACIARIAKCQNIVVTVN